MKGMAVKMNDLKTELSEKDKYDFDDLCRMMTLLRSPDGCPWDREQTHESVRKNFIEEAYEVAEAIDEKSTEHLCEELGDVLLQVVFHAEMEREKGTFDISDVITEICTKLVRRHPHVFGDVKAETSDKVISNWDSIKKEEKKQKSLSDELEGISKTLPSLMRAQKIIKKAGKHSVSFAEENSLIKGLKSDEYANILMQLCLSANEMNIDLEELLEEKCNYLVKNVK